jgi:hypothetical protein
VRVNGAALPPGRPVADPGPARVVAAGSTRLSAATSLFSNTYSWSIVSGPSGAALSEPTSATPAFTASEPGTYVVQLVTGNGGVQSAPAQLTIVVSNSLAKAPAAIRFADIKATMQEGNRCTSCHSADGQQPRPPVFYTNMDRNEDGISGDATDDTWFHAEVRSRINFTDLAASALLRKPSGNHHGGNLISGFDASKPPGDPARERYDLFLNWILNGAPQ